MRRLLWLAAGVALLAGGLYLAGRAPSAYVLEKEFQSYHEERRQRYTLLSFHIARAEKDEVPDLRRELDEFLRRTKTIEIRGWEIVLVPAGARPPGQEHRLRLREDPSVRSDPPQLKGPMEAWARPKGPLARVFAWR